MPTRTTSTPSALPFVADRDSLSHDTGGTINWASVPDSFRTGAQVVTVGAIAAQGATSVTVAALAKPIPSGTSLDFGGAKFARLTAAAAAGATTLTVAALPTALAVSDVATHNPNGSSASGAKFIPAGYPMNGDAVGGMVPANTSSATCLLATNAHEHSATDAVSGYGKILGGVIYSNMLPVTLAGAAVTALKAAGTGFAFKTYADNTGA